MIDSKDLMIGNKIKANDVYQGKIMTFDRLNEDKTVMFFSDGHKWGIGEFLKDCQYVPLTEDILLKCGFGWNIRFQANANEDYFFKLCECYPVEKGYNIVLKKDNFLLVPEVKYLHDFQNLYKALSGKDLQINL